MSIQELFWDKNWKSNQKKINSNLTINDLLNNDVILPSNYFDKFNYHAKEMEINLDDEDFKKNINNNNGRRFSYDRKLYEFNYE